MDKDDIEKEINQDYVSQKELLFADIDTKIRSAEWPVSTKSNKQLIIELYFIDRRKQCDIAYLVGVSRTYVSKIIKESIKKIGIKSG